MTGPSEHADDNTEADGSRVVRVSHHSSTRAALTAGVFGVVAGVGSLALSGVVPLALVTAGSYGVVGWLATRHPDTVTEPDVPFWAFGRWSMLSTVVLLGVTAGTTLWLDLQPARLAALAGAVVGFGAAMWLLGVSYARRKAG